MHNLHESNIANYIENVSEKYMKSVNVDKTRPKKSTIRHASENLRSFRTVEYLDQIIEGLFKSDHRDQRKI